MDSPSEMGASGLSTSSPVAWESDGASTSVDKSSLPTCREEIGLSSGQFGRVLSLELTPGRPLLLRISWHSAVDLARASPSVTLVITGLVVEQKSS
eukprot:5089894-Ditylum_brightwellii.AAC.1